MRRLQTANIKLEAYFDDFSKLVQKEYEKRLWKATNMLRTEVIKSFSEAKHGRVYFVGKTKKIHIASAEGEAPGVWYGGLKRSIRNEVREEDGELVGYVGVPERGREGKTLIWKYATWLEYGTRLMKPRPFLKPAYWKLRNKIKSILERKIKWQQNRLF